MPKTDVFETGREAFDAMPEVIKKTGLIASLAKVGEHHCAVSERTDSFSETCELFLGEALAGPIEIIRFD